MNNPVENSNTDRKGAGLNVPPNSDFATTPETRRRLNERNEERKGGRDATQNDPPATDDIDEHHCFSREIPIDGGHLLLLRATHPRLEMRYRTASATIILNDQCRMVEQVMSSTAEQTLGYTPRNQNKKDRRLRTHQTRLESKKRRFEESDEQLMEQLSGC